MAVRLSGPTLLVLRHMLTDPKKQMSGFELTRLCKVGSGTMYPLLARLERAQWIEAKWEEADASDLGRPLRRYYKLTRLGQQSAIEAINTITMPTGGLSWQS